MCSKLSPPGIYLLRWGGLGKGVVGWCVRAARLCHGRLGTGQTRTCLNAYPRARHPWKLLRVWEQCSCSAGPGDLIPGWNGSSCCSTSRVLSRYLALQPQSASDCKGGSDPIKSNHRDATSATTERKAASHRAPRIWLHVTKLCGGGNPRPFLCQPPRLPMSNRRRRNVPLSHYPSDKEKTTTTNKQYILI